MKLGVVIYTYNKIDEACIQMEIIRKLWSDFFEKIDIVHAYNGNPKDYPNAYLEDQLLYLDNPSHYQGAANMMDAGIEALLQREDLDYFMVNASDVWRIKPKVLTEIIKKMEESECVLGTCPWGFPGQDTRRGVGLATDTFILNANWERKNHIFPLKWKDFHDKYIDIIRYMGHNNVSVEGLLASRYLTACSHIKMESNSFLGLYANDHVYIIKERMPTILTVSERNFDVSELGLYTNHDLNIKKKVLIENNINVGPYCKSFVSA